MKTIKPILIFASLLLSQASFASDDKHEAGEKLYKTHCASCHGATGGMDMSKRVAPPIAAVRLHYIGAHPDEASFVEAVSSWVQKQDASKSLMRGAIQKFNIMPPLELVPKEAKKIAAYIYGGDIEEIEGFKQHVEDEHGKMGMDKDKHGKGHGKHGEGKGQGMHDGGKGKMQGEKMGMHNMMQGQGMDHQQGMNKMRKSMQAKMHHMGKKGGMRGMGKKMMKKLNLSADQQQKMAVLIQEKKSRINPLQKQMHKISRAIRQLDTTSPNYKTQIFKLAGEKAKHVHRMVIEKGEMRMKIESVLSAEQRANFKQLRQERKANKH